MDSRVVGHKPRILLLTTDLKIMKRYSFNSLFEKKNKGRARKQQRKAQKEQ